MAIANSNSCTGDPPKVAKGNLAPLPFKNMQINLNCRKGIEKFALFLKAK